MTIEQIKEQLKTIRLYYADKAGFDAAFSVLPHKVITLAKQYAEVISDAPLDLYLIFYQLDAGSCGGRDELQCGIYPTEK